MATFTGKGTELKEDKRRAIFIHAAKQDLCWALGGKMVKLHYLATVSESTTLSQTQRCALVLHNPATTSTVKFSHLERMDEMFAQNHH